MCSPGPEVYRNVFKQFAERRSSPDFAQGVMEPVSAQPQPQATQGVSSQFANPMAAVMPAIAAAKAYGPGSYRMNNMSTKNGRVIS